MLARLSLVRKMALLALLAWLGATTACAGDADLGGAGPVDAATPDGSADELTTALRVIEGAVVTEEVSFASGYRRFRIAFEQPVDHDDPAGPRFTQMLTLLHRDVTAPMVLVSTGYHDFLRGSLGEPAVLLEANQIVVEHRYFGSSRPQPADWRYLDIEQAAGDHHRVIAALQPLYTGQWISTGASKGGMTSIFHRRFHPDDVTATIAYVAPLNFSVDDARYESFFDQLDQLAGAGDCVQQVRELQRQALLQRDQLIDYFADVATRQGYTFERMQGLARAFEAGVVELEWTYWQYQGLSACSALPTDTSFADLAGFVDGSNVVWTMSDQQASLFEAYYYQVLTQIGYPSVPSAHLMDLLQFDYEAGLALLAPAGVTTTYDPEAMRDMADWVAGEGERILRIYGAHDPWSAGAMTLGADADSYSFVAPGASHGARIADLAADDRAQAIALLRAWAQAPAAPAGRRDDDTGTVAPPAPPTEPVPRPRLGL